LSPELQRIMADEVSRLETLRYGGGADAPSVAAAFELSYRLLHIALGPDLSTATAAQLVGWPGAGRAQPPPSEPRCRQIN
jgi:hypothetical protein